MGKKATTAARVTMARSGWSSPIQITTSGAMATTGVTCRVTASGLTARSMVGLSPPTSARAQAQTAASSRANRAIARVRRAEVVSRVALSTRAWNTAIGGGIT